MAESNYIARLIDPLLADTLSEFPAVLLVGPRATGKTTTGKLHAKSMLRLDRPADSQLVLNDPDVALASFDEPLLIDEWQVAPAVLGAVKRAVDDGSGVGRFILTGSAQTDLRAEGWPATGRIIRLPMFGLTDRELEGRANGPALLDRVFAGEQAELRAPSASIDLRNYVSRAMRSGFPEAAAKPAGRMRSRWLQSYIDEVVTRDVQLVAEVRDPVRLRRYLQACASNTAGIVEHKLLYDAASIERATAIGYDNLLQHLMVVDHLPAWTSNRLSRLVKLPKRHLVEPALVGPLLGVDERAILRDSDLLGRVIESYALAQLRAELVITENPVRLHHLRDKEGRHEIDILAERADGRVIAIEVKATSAPRIDDARHLLWLREQIGDRFVAGIVLHTGPRPFHHESGIAFLPISTMWGSHAS
jgi:uncharacterized protein